MERVLTVEQMRAADKNTIEKLGISEQTLVERAGRAVVDEIVKRFAGGRVLVCIGGGNNGKDGRVIADILSKTHGFTVATYNVLNGVDKLFDKKFDIIVDCIFGTGLNRVVDGKYKNAIEKINLAQAYKVACNIPSGLNGDNGVVMGDAVRANLTVAIQEYKIGLFLNDGPDYTGEVVVKDIGISVWEENCTIKLSDEDVKSFFPKRPRNVNKGTFGKVAILGGSKSFVGSPLLSACALTALKCGTGYSFLYVPQSLFDIYAGKNPEVIVKTYPDENGVLKFDEKATENLMNFDVLCLGMGTTPSLEIYKIIEYLAHNYKGTLIIDADGINSIKSFGLSVLKNAECEIILTPHIGEFCRLTGLDKSTVLGDPVGAAIGFAKEYGVTLVLKNAVSIITDGKAVYLNTTGNSALAKAGSGDVLDGVLCGMAANKDDLTKVCAAACYVFGRAAEKAVEEQNEYTVTASDVIGSLSAAINSL